MKCEWCTTREAKWMGYPVRGPRSRMCDPCKERLCRTDDLGNYLAVPIDEYLAEQAKKKEEAAT